MNSLSAFASPASIKDVFLQTDGEAAQNLAQADSFFEEGNFPAAARKYRDYIERFSRESRALEARVMLAESLYRQALREATQGSEEKIFAEARGEIHRALREIPRGDHLSELIALRLAEIEFNLRRYAEAVEASERWLADHPVGTLRGEVRLLKAQALLAQNQALPAYQALKAALADQPYYEGESRMALAFGIALFEVGNSSDALRYLERLEQPLAHLYAARSHIRLGKPLIAIDRLRALINSDPEGQYAELGQYLLGEAFFMAKNYISALQAFEEFLRLNPRSVYRPAAMYKIGLCQYEREEYLAARGSFQSVLQMTPNSEFAEPSLYMIGEAFMRENRLKEANHAYADMAASFTSALAGSAYFKQGWTHYKQEEHSAAEAALRLMLVKHPAHPLVPAASMLIGNALSAQGRYQDAVRAYQQSLDQLESGSLPEEHKAELRESGLALLSRANYLAGDYGSLVSGYQYFLKHVKPSLNPWRAATFLYMAEGYFRQGLMDQAMNLYKEVIRSYPTSPESSFAQDGLAWTLFAKGDFSAATAAREKLAQHKLRPKVAPTKTVLSEGQAPEELFVGSEFETAAAEFNQKRYLEALDGFERFEKAHPQHVLAAEAALQAGWCYYRLEHYGQALKAWERVESAYAGGSAAVKAAWATADTYFRAGHYDKAIATYERILQTYPQDQATGHARLRIAQSHYNAKDVPRAVAAFEELIRQAPESPEAGEVLDFLTQLLFQPGAKEMALDSLGRIADNHPRVPIGSQARLRIARHFFDAGDHVAAVNQLERSMSGLAGKSELMDAEFYLTESYYQLKRYRDAALGYDRFTENYPGDKRFPAALFHLGAARFKLEEHAEAAAAFSRLAKDFPRTEYAPLALFNSALAYRKLGKWEEAAIALKTYLKNHPEEAKQSNALAELLAIYEEHQQHGLAAELLAQELGSLPQGDVRRVELAYRLAENHAAQGDEAKALEWYQQAAGSGSKKDSFRLAALAKLGERYEKAQRWAEAHEAYEDLARNVSDPQWIEAARVRAAAARERLGQVAVKSSSSTAVAPESPRPRKKPNKKS
ncbi:MAG: tetratricopeptide repeat protein [Elusimicrobia bacterium]|nr:tetratricopeptide repeat protein [Elusimicrobiota bacterium]